MEFISYEQTIRMLSELGVQAAEGEQLRLALPREDEDSGVCRVVIGEGVDAHDAGDGSVQTLPRPREKLGEIVDGILQRLHLGEVVLIPKARWREVLDAAAFDLAQEEVWLEIDAEASLHQNRRDPLMVPPKHRHVIGRLATAVLANGEAGKADLIVAALASPLLLEIRCDGRVLVTCPNPAIADRVAARV